ncbi:MAG: TylF/MycF/NovP-related O-methyltransferase [Candidatus Levybacteria bacterium]|nr:TylF/MycF/NovP-related O-methyltransferase [Candidatus Levybacteria bacterium]
MTPKEKFWRLVFLALQKYRIIPKSPLNYTKLSQKINLCLLYTRVKELKGVIVECGVAQGYSLAVLKILSLAEGQNREVYGFDTFCGLPEPSAFEGGVKGLFGYTKSSVVQFFKDTGVSLNNVSLIEGDIRNTLKTFDKPIAFLHIDVDLYEGYKASLETLWDKIVQGGVVVLDDYDNKSWVGANKAVDEFVKKHGVVICKAEFANKFYLIK